MLADLLFAERMKNKLNEWRSQLRNASSESSNWSTQSTETVFYHMRPALCQSAGSHFSPAQTFSIANSLCSEIKHVLILGSTLHIIQTTLPQNEKLEKYINRLYLSWTSGDIIHLRTGHSNPENWRVSMFKYENIVLVWNFPRKLKARQIKDCICKAFAAHTSQRSYSLRKLKRLVSNQEQDLRRLREERTWSL
ncbi:hypothetical protein IGI04_018792 [Brassica rapa subsp. trilocularis]|uniref:DUF4283 domain-containing protein n=1 Tax=Brassica rapa subsp. trilocularis TaxID=1813537 RepID=A0ABQ7MDZ9_BRACM|nr:hypothetical protein IGI04_018792 [Brassica rapa subsp. trilocularis]